MMSRMIMTMIVVMQGGKPDLEGGRSSLPDLVEVGDQKMEMVGLEVPLLVHQHHEPRKTPSKGQEGEFTVMTELKKYLERGQLVQVGGGGGDGGGRRGHRSDQGGGWRGRRPGD